MSNGPTIDSTTAEAIRTGARLNETPSSTWRVRQVGWTRSKAANLAWVRAFYREIFAPTGGVPAPGDACDGALINHPDTDLADATLNTSGVAWPTIYYQANYPRLQRVKAQWDPRKVFHHALSVR